MVEHGTVSDAERYEMPIQCPACCAELAVAELGCPGCQAVIKGRFTLGPFARLPKEHQNFLLTFVRRRGNIREVERELGLSYPTVRAKLDQAIESLGAPEKETALTALRQDILTLLERGGITAGEAAQRLKAAGRVKQRTKPERGA
jgi:hypothetical protein